jgi:N-acetylglucosamine-6-sulfatase
MLFSRVPMSAWPVAVIALAVLPHCTTAASASAQERSPKPNIVLILTDDEDVAIHEFMPKTRAFLADQGTTFNNFFVSYAFCCPSRASILRGQYGHNTQVLGNELPYGGYEKLRQRGLERSTIATWLQAAGYHTALFGKYINRYEPERGVPPGWTDWYGGGTDAHQGYNYKLNENGRIVAYGSAPDDYANDVLTRKALEVIRRSTAARQPFFLYVSTFTPHSPAAAAPRHLHLFRDSKLPRPPSFDEVDVSDKPAVIQSFPHLEGHALAWLVDEYRRRLRSLQAVDDMVESIVGALEASGVLDRTYVIYTSDNGFHMGEHRMIAGKDTPYDEDIRVPMVIRGPGVPAGARIDAMALNIDLAPTFADMAGIQTPDFVDGRSFLPLLADPGQPWRQSFLVERRQLEVQYIELAEQHGINRDQLDRHAYVEGLRTPEWAYIEYGTGERELYNVLDDPYQLDNAIERTDPSLKRALAARLGELARCAGAQCRELEDRPLSDGTIRPVAVQDQARGALPVVCPRAGLLPAPACPQ